MTHAILTDLNVCVLRQRVLDFCISLRAPRTLDVYNRIATRIRLLLWPPPSDSTVPHRHRYKPTPSNPNVPEKRLFVIQSPRHTSFNQWTNKTGGRDSYKYNHITHEGTIFSNIYSKTGQGCPRGKVSRMQSRIHVVHVDHRVTRSCSRSRADDRGAARFWQAASIICKVEKAIRSINPIFFTIQRNLKYIIILLFILLF